MRNTPEETAAALIKQGFSVKRYQDIQAYRKKRLKFFEERGIDVLINAEQDLINFGEEVLTLLILNELKLTKP